MRNLSFTASELKLLSNVYNLNKGKKKIKNRWNYNIKEKRKFTLGLKKIKTKFNILKTELSRHFQNFDIHLANIRGRNGKFRNYYWLSLVRGNLLNKNTHRYEMGQLQFAVHNNGGSVELLFDRYAWNERGRFIKVIQKFKYSIIPFYYFFGNLYYEKASPENSEEFLRLIRNERRNYFGINFDFSKNELMRGIAFNDIIRKLRVLQKLYNAVYKQTKLIIKSNLRGRKSTKKRLNIEDYFWNPPLKGSKVERKHNKLQEKIFASLKRQYPNDLVEKENNFVDIKVVRKNELRIYEIKTDDRPLICIRQALGQLMFYAFRERLKRKNRKKLILIAVGPSSADMDTKSLSEQLQKDLRIDFAYHGVPDLT